MVSYSNPQFASVCWYANTPLQELAQILYKAAKKRLIDPFAVEQILQIPRVWRYSYTLSWTGYGDNRGYSTKSANTHRICSTHFHHSHTRYVKDESKHDWIKNSLIGEWFEYILSRLDSACKMSSFLKDTLFTKRKLPFRHRFFQVTRGQGQWPWVIFKIGNAPGASLQKTLSKNIQRFL